MPNPVSSAEIEDVLSSIRRLVSDDPQTTRPRSEPVRPVSDRLVLTPAQRVTVQLDDVEAPDQSWEPATDEPDLAEIAEETAGDPADVGDALARVAADPAEAGAVEEEALSLEDRIAGLEAALGASEDEWEPDGSEDFSRDLTRPLSADTNFDMATAWRENPGQDESGEVAPEAEHVPEPSPEIARATSYRLEDRLMAIDLSAVDRLLTETNSRAGDEDAATGDQGDETLFADSSMEEDDATPEHAEDQTTGDEIATTAEDEGDDALATVDETALDAVEENLVDDDLAEAGDISDDDPVLGSEELETGEVFESASDSERSFDEAGLDTDDAVDEAQYTEDATEADEIVNASDVESIEAADTEADLSVEDPVAEVPGVEAAMLVEEEQAQPAEWTEEADSADQTDFAVSGEEIDVVADNSEVVAEEYAEEPDELEVAETADAAEEAETLILGEAEFSEGTAADGAVEAADVTPLRLETVADDDTVANLDEPAGEEPLLLHPEDGIVADDGDVPLDEIADLVALDGGAEAADPEGAVEPTAAEDAEPIADGLEDVLDTLGLELEAEADAETDAVGVEEGDKAVLDVSPDELSDVIEAAFGEEEPQPEDTEASETPEDASAAEVEDEAEADVAAPAAEVPSADLDEDDAHEFASSEEHVSDVGSTDAPDDIDVDTVAEAVAAALDQEVSDAVFAEFSRIDEEPEVADDAFIEDPEFLDVASLAEVEAAEQSDEAEAEEVPESASKEVGVDIDAVLSAMSAKAGGSAPLSEDTQAPDETPDDSEPVVEEDAQSAEPADVPFVAARATPTPTETPAAEADTTADLAVVASAAAGAASSGEETADESIFAESAAMGEDALRDLVAQLVREELQGVLGERITRNVRRLVRREIERALSLRDLS